MSNSDRIKIAVDLDETLCDFMTHFLIWYNGVNNTNWRFSDVIDYDWAKFLNITQQDAMEFVYEFFKTDEFKNMPPVDEAKEVIQQLAKEYSLYLVTARQNVVEEDTILWVNTHFNGLFEEVILTNDYSLDNLPKLEKGDVCKKKGCSIIIDDNPYNIKSLLGGGIRIILLNKLWNKDYSGSCPNLIRVDNLKEVLSVIKTLTCS